MEQEIKKLPVEKQELVDKIIKMMETEKKWQKVWRSLESPYNVTTSKDYKGTNNIRLLLSSLENKFNDPRWITFNQAKENDWSIKKGEKGTSIFFYQLTDKKTKKPFDNKTLEGMTEDEKNTYIETNVYFLTKKYTVFNGQQIDGIEKYTERENKIDLEKRNELLEKIIEEYEVTIQYDEIDRAYYNPSTDEIHLPKKEQFNKIEDLYSISLHEIAHSTGHENRLNRKIFNNKFGSEEYAKEELVAEFASIFIGQETGIKRSEQDLKNHASYLKLWKEIIKNNPNALFESIKDAQKVEKFILEKYDTELMKIKEEYRKIEKPPFYISENKEFYIDKNENISIKENGKIINKVSLKEVIENKSVITGEEFKHIIYENSTDNIQCNLYDLENGFYISEINEETTEYKLFKDKTSAENYIDEICEKDISKNKKGERER